MAERIPEDQLEEIIASIKAGLSAPPPPSVPPDAWTGKDATLIREIMREEVQKLYDRFKKDQERLFRRLRMPIDEENINETSDQLNDLFELNKTIKSVTKSWWKDVIGSVLKWLGAAALAAGAYTGFNGVKH